MSNEGHVPSHLPKDSTVEFSDSIYDNHLEFHHETKQGFPITHKIDSLGKVSVPPLILKLSATQLVTLSGAMSGFLAGVIVCPLDVVKTRLQAKGADTSCIKSKTGFIGEFSSILKQEGFRGLYRGLVPITIGYIPTWTIYFTIYERAKMFFPSFWCQHNINSDTLNHISSALTAGLASSIIVNPVWVVKTRLMTQAAPAPAASTTKLNQQYYKGTIDAFRKMYREEGVRVFYSGLVPSLFGLLHVGIHFPVYEKLKQLTGSNEMNDRSKNFLLLRLIFASSLAKMIASTVTYPHEILRTRMQIRTKQKETSVISYIVNIYRKEGLKGFYAGYIINLIRTVPASAVTLVSFEYFKTYLLEISGKKLESDSP